MTPLARAVLLVALAAFIFTVETTLIKAVTDVPLTTLVLARAVGQVLWVLPIWIRDPTLPRTRILPMQLLRAFLSNIAWYSYYLSFSGLPLATATVLSFTTVLFVTALAGPALGETVGWRRWTATLVGFCGVLAIVRPGEVPLGWPVLGALASCMVGSMIVLTTKALAKTERTVTIMFWVGVVALAIALPVAWPGLAWPGWGNFGLLALVAFCGPCAMQIWITAMRLADASVIAPISYIRLVFASLFGVVLFGEVPDPWLALGAVLIVGSALYITRRESRLARERASAAASDSSSTDTSSPKAP